MPSYSRGKGAGRKGPRLTRGQLVSSWSSETLWMLRGDMRHPCLSPMTPSSSATSQGSSGPYPPAHRQFLALQNLEEVIACCGWYYSWGWNRKVWFSQFWSRKSLIKVSAGLASSKVSPWLAVAAAHCVPTGLLCSWKPVSSCVLSTSCEVSRQIGFRLKLTNSSNIITSYKGLLQIQSKRGPGVEGFSTWIWGGHSSAHSRRASPSQPGGHAVFFILWLTMPSIATSTADQHPVQTEVCCKWETPDLKCITK